MSPGQQAYARFVAERGAVAAWESLSDDERDTWERGASMSPVGAILDLRQAADEKR